jgi:hypothetical protein
MRRWSIRPYWFLVALICMAALPSRADQKQEPLQALRQRADSASRGDRAKLFGELAHREVEDANTHYSAGEIEKGQMRVQQAVHDAESATDAAVSSRKRLKQTEKLMHALSRRLEDVRRSVTVEDRPPIKAAIDRLEQLDRDLLNAMFGTKE